jgi:toxin ParE1/3/4
LAQIVWLSSAIADLEAVCAFLGRRPESQAERLAGRIFEQVDRLRDFPRSGRPVREVPLTEDVRELIVEPYRIAYQVDRDRVLIVTIQHGARGTTDEEIHEPVATYAY